MSQIWGRALELFEGDDGALPGIEIAPLTPTQVIEVHKLICERGTLGRDARFWCYETNSERQLNSVPDAAERVTSGKASPFHHMIHDLTVEGVRLPLLGVFVFEDSVELDYRRGSEWGPEQVEALFKLLSSISKVARDARISLEDEVSKTDTDLFQCVWSHWKSR